MKYIFFDIDHTLVSHVGTPHIPDETREAVNRLKLAGHIPAIATGRASFLTFKTAQEFGINYIVCSGGAEIFVDGKEIFTAYFPEEHISKFLDVAKKFPSRTAAVDKKFLYASDAFSDFKAYFNNQAGYDCVKSIDKIGRVILCYLMLPSNERLPEHGIFCSPPENTRLELMHQFTEIRHECATKWRGIVRMIEHERASLDDIITFGDGPNDADMLRNAKIGVAVKRSSQEAQDAADYICEDIDEGGILKACYELGLIK